MSFDVVIAVSYYSPYVSGLTEVARNEAEGLAERGLRVLVVANQHDAELRRVEEVNGVAVIRCPVLVRHGRGIFSPSFVPTVLRHSRTARALHIHAPLLEAGVLARRAAPDTRVVLTHHIDLWVPRTFTSPLAIAAVNASTKVAIGSADLTIVNSMDQARGSRFWSDLRKVPLLAIPAACEDRRGGTALFRESSGPHFGFLGRIVEDKGLDYLIDAFQKFDDPRARLLIGGDYLTVAGGSVMTEIQSRISRDPRIRVLGLLRGEALRDFYASIDTFLLPSVAESFGIAQAEAIMVGVPSITTNIPGGRYPVVATGLGTLIRPRSSEDLLRAMRHPHNLSDEKVAQAAEWALVEFGVNRFLDRHVDALGLSANTTISCEESR